MFFRFTGGKVSSQAGLAAALREWSRPSDMRTIINIELILGRIRSGYMASDETNGLQGAYRIDGPCGMQLFVIACDGTDKEALGWEHVSVSLKNRTPNWTEMSFVKNLFWDDEETVMQFHPPRSVYVNNHDHCLHMWKQVGVKVSLPPIILIGYPPDMGDNILDESETERQ